MSKGINLPIFGVLLVYLFALICIGLYYQRKVKTAEDYWVGGREVGPITTAVSFNASYCSTVVVIGSPAYYFMFGMGYQVFEAWSSTLFLGVLVFVVIGLKMRAVTGRTGDVSMPGFLATRFQSKVPKVLSAILIAVMMVPYGIAVLKAIGDAMNVLVGVSYTTGVVLISITALIYLSASGVLGMAKTDLLQGFTILLGVILLAISVIHACGGPTDMFTGIGQNYPELLTIPGPLPWGLFLSYTMIYPLIAFGQPQLVTKFISLKDTRTIGTVILTNIVFLFLLLGAILGIGLGARHLFTGQEFANMDVIAPLVASTYGNTLVQAVFLCGAVAAGMSTFVSIMMSASAALCKDLYEDCIPNRKKDVDTLKLSKICTTVLIVLTSILSLKPWDVVWQISAMAAGTMGAAFTAPILFGLYWKRATNAGCVASIVGGSTVTILCYVLGMTETVHPFIPGMAASILLMVVVSLMTQRPEEKIIDIFFKKDLKAE